MKNKNENEELQSRREFFKKAAKAALPVIGMTVANPLFAQIGASVNYISSPNPLRSQCQCSGGCAGGCQTTCYGDCTGDCQSNCYGTCESSGSAGNTNSGCYNGCFRSCAGGCTGTCYRTCSGSCSGYSYY